MHVCDIHGRSNLVCADCARGKFDTATEEIDRLTEELTDIRALAEGATEYVLAQINEELNNRISEIRRAWREYTTTPTTESWERLNLVLTELE